MDETKIAEFVRLIQEGKVPEWWREYAGQLAYNLQVHTKGLMFDKVTGLFPNEHPESQQHCINSFESITKGPIWKGINNIIRVFNNSSYNIQISEKTREDIEAYQKNEGSFFSQFLEDWIKNAIATDPNGLCVWYPPAYTDDFYRYISHKDLVVMPHKDYLIFVSEVESEKKFYFKDTEYTKEIYTDYTYAEEGQPNVRRKVVRTYNRRLETDYLNKVYHVFTKTHFIRFYKDKPGDAEFKYEFWKHPKELETLPYFESGGVEVENDLYESFVQPFIPFGNLALLAHRNQRAVELMFYYPKMSEVQTECDTCLGGSGYMDVACTQVCKTCKGSKYVSIQSPYKVYRKVPDSFDTDNKILSAPSVEYYSPNVGILEKVDKKWVEYLEQGEESIYVQQRQDTGAVQAAKSKQLDQEGLFAWLSNISKVFFNNLEMGLQYRENYVNASPVFVSVERPYSFAILTESEAFEALGKILDSSAHVSIKANQIDSFVNKFISESSPIKRALRILRKFDLLLYYSSDEITALKGQGSVDAKMVQRHALAYPVLIQMYELDNSLFEMEDSDIITKLTEEVEKYDMTKDLRTTLLKPVKEVA